VTEPNPTFDREIIFDPAGDFDALVRDIPAKWAIYLMADETGRPVQLLSVKNLRYSIKRRLGVDEELAGPSRRVDYRALVRRISWRRVDSAFEADCVYLEFARQLFPQTYQGMVGFRPAWFVHVNPDSNFPRYIKTRDLGIRTGVLMGPLEDKHVAGRLVEQAVDWFDLCRYYHILTEAPNGKACAYKEMGKCPAPCDGSISMGQYRRLVDWSARSIVDPAEMIRDQQQRMNTAAAELRFETAGKIKAFIDSLSQLGKGSFRHVRRLSDFKFIALQRGPRDGSAKVFLITPGEVQEIACLPHEPTRPADILRLALTLAADHSQSTVHEVGTERIGVVSHHLFLAKAAHGVFLPLDSVDEKSIARAYRELLKQKAPEESESEGVMKELQAM
jgi:excinuclease UvrABC nuclease subunit